MAFPIIPCNLCGSQPNLQRKVIKDLLQSWEKQFPGRLETIFTSLQNAAPSHLLDRSWYDFQNSARTAVVDSTLPSQAKSTYDEISLLE